MSKYIYHKIDVCPSILSVVILSVLGHSRSMSLHLVTLHFSVLFFTPHSICLIPCAIFLTLSPTLPSLQPAFAF
ncbi:MAG TPA: hypothetical protein VEY10_20125, partial [Flavisolibacter sp.]|nr:hypothetical protein [Flavisolibacter sp.]